MKQCTTAIAFCVLLTACDRGSRSITGPMAPPVGPSVPVGFFSLTGRVQDFDGSPVADALVRLDSDSSAVNQATRSDASGEYRFDEVHGRALLRVSKNDYADATAVVWVARNETLNVSLQRLLHLIPGTPLLGTVQAPPCDPVGWDATALCQTVYFTPSTSDSYEIVLSWNGPNELDMLIDASTYWVAGRTNPYEIRGIFYGAAGLRREIRIHSYYSPQAFTLTATPRTGP